MDEQRIPLISDVDEITVEWLRQALAAGGASTTPDIAGLEVEQLSGVTNALGNLYRCRMTARDGGTVNPASVIVKFPSADALVFRFSRWLSRHTATCGRRPCSTVISTRAATDEPVLSACGDFLNTRESRIMQTVYLLTLPATLDRFGDLFTAETRRLAEEFGVRITAQFAAVSAGPKTVVHGDFRADNMLFGGGQDELAVIDWQGFGIGCGMYDVAFFLGTSVTDDVRCRIERDALDEYHDIVRRFGAES